LAGGRLPEGLQELLHSRSNQTMLLQVLQQVDWLVAYAVEASNSSALPMSLSVPRQKMGLRFVDKYMSANRNSLSGYDASEGVLYLLFFVVLALHSASPPLIAIDNFDQALNPRLARDFTRVFCEWVVERGERQILLTTHNPLVLDGLPLQDPRVRLFAVDRSRKGATIVNRVEVTDAIMSRTEKGMTLSQQWVMGHFGGVPASA
jgi:predicted ATPase